MLAVSDPKTTQALQVQRVKILLAAKNVIEAKDLLKELIATHPDDLQLLSLGIETMLNAGEFSTAESWEKQLLSLNLPEDYLWQYFRIRRFLHKYKSLTESEQTELRQLIASLRSSRPGWHSVFGLEAHYAELRGDTLLAIEKYQQTIKLGGISSGILKRLVLLLNNEGRFSDADNYLSLLSTRQGGTLQVESLEISSAFGTIRCKKRWSWHVTLSSEIRAIHNVWFGLLVCSL